MKDPDLPYKVIAVLIMVGLIVGFGALYGYLAYGDWTCGFTHCVKVKQ